MRILQWSDLFWPYIGGVEVVNAKMLPKLRDLGYDLAVVTSHDYLDLPDYEQFNDIPVHRFGFRRALAENKLEDLWDTQHAAMEVIARFKPDLIYLSSVGPSALICLRVLKSLPVPMLVTLQQQVLPGQSTHPNSVLYETLRHADWVVAVSATVLEQARQLNPEIRPRSSVIHNVVDIPKVATEPLPYDKPRLLCLGRLVPQKGLDLAVRAFAAIHQHYPTARLVFAGDGTERSALERLVAESGIADAAEFLGWVAPEQVPALLNTATIVVMPSRQEGLPVAAVQAAIMGRPIIATPVGGVPEVVKHGKTGLLVDKEDTVALAEAMCSLLGDKEKTIQMGHEARKMAIELFSFERLWQSYDALFKQLAPVVSSSLPDSKG